MKPLFHEFEFGGGASTSHRKLFEDDPGMDFLGRPNDCQSYYDIRQNYYV
jgi:hypothetical protein